MTNQKLNKWLPLILAIVLIGGMMAGYSIKTNFKLGKTFSGNAPVEEVMGLIRQRYVDEVNVDTLTEAAIDQMMNKLDPHSHYISARELQSVNEDLEGRFQGIGVEFTLINDTINIVYVIKDGPSDMAGLQVGDKIIKANGKNLAGIKIMSDSVRHSLRGPYNSQVTVDLLRNGQAIQKTITRGYIPIPSLEASYMINATTGFIKLNKFSETTYDEFLKALTELKKNDLQQLILDLRDNGGGVLDEAVNIADEFLDGDKLIVYTEGKHLPRKEYRCKKPGLFETGKLVVLVDETSASASEVLTGALQDWDRARIIGRRTFGKGLVQEQYSLSNGSALRLTVARYYTPTGRSIQKPYDDGVEAYEDELMKRYHSAEMVNADSNKKITSAVYKTLKLKRTVYGGGGITPDVFIPLDTTLKYDHIGGLYQHSSITNFVYSYYLRNKAKFDQFKTAAQLKNGFGIDESVWKEFSQYATKDSVDLSKITAKEKEYVSQLLMQSFGRQIWRMEGYNEMKNYYDDEIQKALEELKKQ